MQPSKQVGYCRMRVGQMSEVLHGIGRRLRSVRWAFLLRLAQRLQYETDADYHEQRPQAVQQTLLPTCEFCQNSDGLLYGQAGLSYTRPRLRRILWTNLTAVGWLPSGSIRISPRGRSGRVYPFLILKHGQMKLTTRMVCMRQSLRML